MHSIDVSHNHFSCPVDLVSFSPAARLVRLNDNKFTGLPDLTRLPVDLVGIYIYNNDWDSLMPPL